MPISNPHPFRILFLAQHNNLVIFSQFILFRAGSLPAYLFSSSVATSRSGDKYSIPGQNLVYTDIFLPGVQEILLYNWPCFDQ